MILSAAELVELTGAKRRRGQVRWLSARGWLYEVNDAGRVIVARAEFDAHLVSGKPASTESAIRWGEVNGRKAA